MNNRKSDKSARGAGRLYKRYKGRDLPANSPIQAFYWLQFTAPNPKGGRGVTIRRPLRDDCGRPITDKKQAEVERDRIMAPFITRNLAETQKIILARLALAETAIAAADDNADPPIPIAEAWEAYRQSPERPDSGQHTMRQYEGHWLRFQKWMREKHPKAILLRDVTTSMAAAYAGNLQARKLSGNRFNKHIGFLRILFKSLADQARITQNPFNKIKRKIQRPASRRELVIHELLIALDRAPDTLSDLILIGATTGLRLGDCCLLKWNDVDLAHGLVRKIPNKTAKTGKPVLIGIPPRLAARLTEIPTHRRTGYIIPAIAAQYRRNPGRITDAIRNHFLDCGIDVHAPNTGTQIIRRADGTPETDGNGKIARKTTGRRAIVEVGFHSFRHTWVSMHAAAGTPGAVVQATVGHANPAMTAHYTHVGEDTARAVALALPVFTNQTTSPIIKETEI